MNNEIKWYYRERFYNKLRKTMVFSGSNGSSPRKLGTILSVKFPMSKRPISIGKIGLFLYLILFHYFIIILLLHIIHDIAEISEATKFNHM